MITTHNLGFPRIGKKRELKIALEKYWNNTISPVELEQTAHELRQQNWDDQSSLDLVPVGDFSFYDQVLDTSFMLGVIPRRAQGQQELELDTYFRVARGKTATDTEDCHCISAGEMTKWFDTNYHYIVPEFDRHVSFKLNAERLLIQIEQAQEQNIRLKPVILGPVTYLWLGKSKDDTDKLDLLEEIIAEYASLLKILKAAGIEWLQIDEPILVTELSREWQNALKTAYEHLQIDGINILLATYFGPLKDNLTLTCELPVQGLHLDAINAKDEISKVIETLPVNTILSLGIIDGRNIWRTDLTRTLDWLEPLYKELSSRLWLAPSCSLLHVPVDLGNELKLNTDIKSWLAFGIQKLEELRILGSALDKGRKSVSDELIENKQAINHRRKSKLVHNEKVKKRIIEISDSMGKRNSAYPQRASQQQRKFKLPLYPSTTIGSFPQTREIRQVRKDFRQGKITQQHYDESMQQEIKTCVHEQETLGLDVLVHGEPERNDMVEYFGEHLAGFAFTENGWVQSYGSRCVKPPILYGDISRPKAITVDWTTYAQSLTEKPMKGMLTGPVTILNWSFVRDDQPRSTSCLQVALAMRDEVLDLEQAGIGIIQIDEAALREGLPLRKAQWKSYLNWAIRAFRITANGVGDDTQIHTHMCYSEFNDIIEAITKMDADVITIETSRSDMELLDVFDQFKYPNEIGPGVYDIHSPNIPDVSSMVDLMKNAAQRIPAERLWINPDCGLKTRHWHEVKPALENMLSARDQLVNSYKSAS